MFLKENIYYVSEYLLWNFVLYISYKPTHNLMDRYISNYREITPIHKKKYVVSNLLKGLVLGINSHLGINFLYNYYKYNIWDLETIKMFGAIYAALDMVSMFKVEKMQTNTTIHHIMVQLLYFYGLLVNNFDKTTLSNPIVIYAIYSGLAFFVNIYLSLRIFIDDDIFLKVLKRISFIIYLCCCCQNWSYQLFFLLAYRDINIIKKIVYSMIIATIMYDDLVLMKYLKK